MFASFSSVRVRKTLSVRKGRVPKPVRSGGIGDELEAEATPGGGAAGAERGRREAARGARGEVDDHELAAAVGGEQEGAGGCGQEVEVLARWHGGGEDGRDGDAEPAARGPVEAPDGGVAGRELLEEEQPRGGRAAAAGGRRGEVVEAAEVRGGDEAGERARHGAHAEELRDGEAEQDLVEELRREQQQRAQRRGGRARGRWVVVLAGEGVVGGHGREGVR